MTQNNKPNNIKKEKKYDDLEKILNDKENKISELTNDLKRLQAEFENYQKRSDKQNNAFKELANASLIESLLPILDSLEIGLKHNKELTAIHSQMNLILKKSGLEKIIVKEGDDFNHEMMDCLFQEQNPKLRINQVTQVLSNGYLLNNKILRTVKVSVNSNEKIVEPIENLSDVIDEKNNVNETKKENGGN